MLHPPAREAYVVLIREIGGQKLSVGYRILRGSTVDSERCRVLDERHYSNTVH